MAIAGCKAKRRVCAAASLAISAAALCVIAREPTAPLMPTPATSMPATSPASEPASQPTSMPATRPTTRESAYERLLGGASAAERPLLPTPRPIADVTSGMNAVQPNAPAVPTRREGSYIVNQIGRLAHAADGNGWEFIFIVDGTALQDPPMKVLPNLKLMGMETQLETLGVDMQFRVTGMVTEYRGRNFILFEKVIVVQNGK